VTVTSSSGSNSGQLSLSAGCWKIDYTVSFTITSTLTLGILNIFICDLANADLDIIGLNLTNYYNQMITTGTVKISASGTDINTTSSKIYILRLIPSFVGGTANFTGKISATRIS